MSALAALIESGKHIASLLGLVRDAAKKLDKYEIIAKLSELQAEFLDLQQQQSELINESMELKEEIRRLVEMMEVRERLEFAHNCYWIRKDDGSLDGPFDTMDWDSERKLVRLHLMSKEFNRSNYNGLHQFWGRSSKDLYVPQEFLKENCVQIGFGQP